MYRAAGEYEVLADGDAEDGSDVEEDAEDMAAEEEGDEKPERKEGKRQRQ